MLVFKAIPGWMKFLMISFSYPAVFAVSLLGTATIFVPFPLDTVVSFAVPGLGLNPIMVGLSAGIGSSIGELMAYLVGRGGRDVVEKRREGTSWTAMIRRKYGAYKWIYWVFDSIDLLFKRYGIIIISLCAAIPFPFDVVGLLAGYERFDVKHFFAATAIGRCCRTLLLAHAGWLILL